MYDLYQKLRTIPLVGTLVKALRDLYHHPWVDAQRLKRRDRKSAHACIDKFFGTGSEAHAILEEFITSPYFGKEYAFGHSGDFDIMMLYVFTRMTKPEVVVETGVASGRSSSAILYALERNNAGKLYSIDLPKEIEGGVPTTVTNSDGHEELSGFLEKGKLPGWLIPDNLRSRWELILGDSNVEIPKLLNTLERVDMFYHDGDHSYDSMAFEFRVMWEKIPKGGFLFSDDTKWNDAWKEFVSRNAGCPNLVYRSLGIIQK